MTTSSFVLLGALVVTIPACAAPGTTVLPACSAGRAGGAALSTFFPNGSFAEDGPAIEEHRQRWYSKHLAAMREPSLSCSRPASAEAYRFVWLRSFHEPWAVRVERTPGGAHLFAVETSGRGGYDPGRPSDTISREIGSGGWNTVVACVQSADFWNLPLKDPRLGLDGAAWIVEGLRAGEYRVISRWSPDTGPFYELGRCFMRLAGREDVNPVY